MAVKPDPQAALPPQFENVDTLLAAVRKEHPEATKKDVVLAMLDMMAAPAEATGLVRTLRNIADGHRGGPQSDSPHPR